MLRSDVYPSFEARHPTFELLLGGRLDLGFCGLEISDPKVMLLHGVDEKDLGNVNDLSNERRFIEHIIGEA